MFVREWKELSTLLLEWEVVWFMLLQEMFLTLGSEVPSGGFWGRRRLVAEMLSHVAINLV